MIPRADRAGRNCGKRNAKEYLKIAGPVHQCRFLERLWLRAHKLADQKDTKAGGQIHQHQANRTVEQSDLSETQIDWDDSHLRGEHQPDEHHEKNAIAAREGQPCKCESSESAGDKLPESDEHGDFDAIPVDLQERGCWNEGRPNNS